VKLIIAVIQDKDVPKLMDALVRAGYSATKLASTGGFLREGNSTILIGVDDDEIENVLEIVKDNCRAREQLVTPITPVGPADLTCLTPWALWWEELRFSSCPLRGLSRSKDQKSCQGGQISSWIIS